MRGIEDKCVLYTLFMHLPHETGWDTKMAMNIGWNDPKPEIKKYITDLMNQQVVAQRALHVNLTRPYMILSSQFIPTWMKPHIQSKLYAKKYTYRSISHMDLKTLSEGEVFTMMMKFLDIIKLENVFDGKTFFNDIFFNVNANHFATIKDLGIGISIKSATLRHSLLLSKSLKIMSFNQKKFEIKHFECYKNNKYYATINDTIIQKLKKWVNLVRDKIKKRFTIKPPIRKPPKPPNLLIKSSDPEMTQDKSHKFKTNKGFISCNWRKERRTLIMHHKYYTIDFITKKTTWIRCVDDQWIMKNKWKQNVHILSGHVMEDEYVRIRDKFLAIKLHLRVFMTDEELKGYLISNEDESKILLDNIKVLWLYQFF